MPTPAKRNIIRRRTVRQRVGLSDVTMWRWERDGKFPKRVALSDSGAVGWFEDEIDAWVAARIKVASYKPSPNPNARRSPTPEAPAALAAASAKDEGR